MYLKFYDSQKPIDIGLEGRN
ncbi:hypothetical protein XFF6990_190006 [Xanthomonas citri pv. fuscans]|nr:hypothetical protein XFF6990_190006 [Xanthomonas citri pv. fuscans]